MFMRLAAIVGVGWGLDRCIALDAVHVRPALGLLLKFCMALYPFSLYFEKRLAFLRNLRNNEEPRSKTR